MFCIRIVYHDILSHVLRFDEASGCVIFSVQWQLASSLYANRLKTDEDHVIIATQSKKNPQTTLCGNNFLASIDKFSTAETESHKIMYRF